jgi:hypothetical protein
MLFLKENEQNGSQIIHPITALTTALYTKYSPYCRCASKNGLLG